MWDPGAMSWSRGRGQGGHDGAGGAGGGGGESGHGKGAWGDGVGRACVGGVWVVGHAMDMGRVHGGVRAGRAERAGMHRGPLKPCDRSTRMLKHS